MEPKIGGNLATNATPASELPPPPRLDPAAPGPWLLYHHKENLICKLEKPKNGLFTNIWSNIWRYVSVKCEKLSHTEEEQRKLEEGRKELEEEKGMYDNKRFRISFAELQRMHMRKLQCKLLQHVVEMYHKGDETTGWEAALKDYIKALQDYDYMNECSQRIADPFLATGERFIDMMAIYRAMQSVSKKFYKTEFEIIDSIGPWKWSEDSAAIGGTRHKSVESSETRSFYKRLGIATLGGVFLLAPMWLMVLHHTLYTALVSTTVSVVVFGLVMAWFLENVSDVALSTAAYAAVLVVFVGLNTHF